DNHDVARIYGVLGRDLQKLKIALGWLLTLRGIPCLYYGTEILMAHTDGHGLIRQDFPGGWPDDKVNKFFSEGRTNEENEIFRFISSLNHMRKAHPALSTGRFTHFVPREGLYFYTKTDKEGGQYLIISNVKSQSIRFNPSEFISLSSMRHLFGDKVEIEPNATNDLEVVVPAKSFSIYKIK
ncbi:MAG: alpha-amylase family glycosyl hydrolase, partial [Thermaurantimonas sp.]|uniref:alpha-amylase family glycosyl hydrolase n=1 Tax=Thermaurantimonas sp. TaxID=2681568 RepID=UPI00391C157C